MVETSPKTFPIALAIISGFIIVTALITEHLGSIERWIAICVGVVFLTMAMIVYVWERNKHYEDRKDIHL